MMDLILASQSPRRQQLLAQLGVEFRIEIADVDESPYSGESPDSMTIRLARLKATTVWERSDTVTPVLGGDTTVALKGEMLGKPRDRNEAVTMLRRLSAKTHVVHSAVALVTESGVEHRLASTDVSFGPLTNLEIEHYCDSGEPFDKAGAYAIQGSAGQFVRRIEGSYSGVVGLPLFETRELLNTLKRP